MTCSFIVINAIIIATICIVVVGTCLGVTLGLGIQTMNEIGRGYAESIVSGLHSTTLKYFVDVEALLMSADRHAKTSAPLSPSHVVGRNWTDDWVAHSMNVQSRRNFSMNSFITMFLEDLFWTNSGVSGDRPLDGFYFEWYENLKGLARTEATEDDITIGGARWIRQRDGTITKDPTLTVAESYPRKHPRRPSVTTAFDQLVGVLKNRKTDPGCQWLGNNHVKNTDIQVYWSLIGACTVRNTTNHLIALSIGAIDAIKDLAQLLRSAAKSPNGHNFIVDQSGLMMASTHPEPLYTSVPTTKTAPVPPGCSSTEQYTPGTWNPPWLGCRKTPATFPYAPLNALSPEMYSTTTEAIVDVSTSEGSFLVASRRVQTKFGGIILNVITVIPHEDIYGNVIGTAIGLAVGLAILVTLIAIAVMWLVLSQVLAGLEALQKEMEGAATIGHEDPADNDGSQQQQQQQQNDQDPGKAVSDVGATGGGGNEQGALGAQKISGWAVVFGAMHDDDLDISKLDDAPAEEPKSTEENDHHPHQRRTRKPPERQSDGSIITEIAAVELAYKTAIAALRKSSAFVPRQLLAAELLHQRRLSKASALAAGKSPDRDLQRIATTKNSTELACSIPSTRNQVSILLIQLEQMAEINKLVTEEASLTSSAAEGSSDTIRSATALLQAYFKKVTRCVMSHGGIVHSFAGSGGEESAIMASWGAPIQREEHSVLAVLCALAIRREMTKEDGQIRALCTQVFGSGNRGAAVGASSACTLRVRIAVASGTALSGCVRDPQGQIFYNLVGGPVSVVGRLLAAAKRWQVQTIVEENAAKACDKFLKFRALCLAKIKHGGGVTFVYEPMGVDGQSEVVLGVQHGKLARDAIVAAQRRNLRHRAHDDRGGGEPTARSNVAGLSDGSQGALFDERYAADAKNDGGDQERNIPRNNDDNAAAAAATSDTDSASYRRVMRSVYAAVVGGSHNGAAGSPSPEAAAASSIDDDGEDSATMSSFNLPGAASLRLSEAMSASTLHVSDNRALAEVLVPNAASVERLLRWHADQRTTVDAANSRYADEFSLAAREAVCLNFAEAANRIRNMLDNDELFPPRVKAHDGALKYLSYIVEMFKGQRVHPRNLHRITVGNKTFSYFCDLMRINFDAL